MYQLKGSVSSAFSNSPKFSKAFQPEFVEQGKRVWHFHELNQHSRYFPILHNSGLWLKTNSLASQSQSAFNAPDDWEVRESDQLCSVVKTRERIIFYLRITLVRKCGQHKEKKITTLIL